MFILGRFVNAVSEAAVEASGRTAEFRGEAVASLPPIARNLGRLSNMLRDDLGGPLRFGIGVDGSSTVSGEIGYGVSRDYDLHRSNADSVDHSTFQAGPGIGRRSPRPLPATGRRSSWLL
jgi:hypothetical protein